MTRYVVEIWRLDGGKEKRSILGCDSMDVALACDEALSSENIPWEKMVVNLPLAEHWKAA